MFHKTFFDGRSVFVTGATGFIGSHLLVRLAQAGARVSALKRPGASNAPGPGRPALWDFVRSFEGDIRDGTALKAILSEDAPDIVFHLAAFIDVRRDPSLEESCRAVNFKGTRNLAKALEGSGVKRVVHFGTCEEYGDGTAPFEEDAAVRPVSPYSESKAAASRYMQEKGLRGTLPVVVLRPFLAYGRGQDPRRFLYQAVAAALCNAPLPMTPGEQTREFNHVEDLADGAMRAGAVKGIEGEIINLACGEERKLVDVARLVYRLAGAAAQPEPGAISYRKGEAMRFFGDTKKCRRLLGYDPKRDFTDGLRDLIAWERQRRDGGNNGE